MSTDKFEELITFIKNHADSIDQEVAVQLVAKIKTLHSARCKCGKGMGEWCQCGSFLCEKDKGTCTWCKNCPTKVCQSCSTTCQVCKHDNFCPPCFLKHKCSKCQDCDEILMKGCWMHCEKCRDKAQKAIVEELERKKARVEKRKQ